MKTALHSSLAAVFAAVSLLGALPASAQGPATGPGSEIRMQRERLVCDGVQQDRAACLREAGAARDEARRGGLTSGQGGDQNAMARCDLQPPADRADCEARVRGTGAGRTSVEGSVMGGGLIRETVTPIPAPAAPTR